MSDHPAAKPSGGVLKWALWGAAIFGVAAVVYIMAQASFKPGEGGGDLKALAKGEMKALVIPAAPAPAPVYSFRDADGEPVRIADFKGKVVVVNIWATWCAPCVVEMPTLAKLQAHYADQPVVVVAVSLDGESALEKAKLFIGKNAPLKFYNDPAMKLPFQFIPNAAGMPTTVIYDKAGVEQGRLAGGAEWDGPDAKALIDAILAKG